MAIWNERIRNKRLEKGITLAQIADILGVTEATAQRYESGSIKSVPYEHMCAYGQLFNCSPAYLMGWESDVATNHSDPNEERLIEIYRTLPTESKNKLYRYASALAEMYVLEQPIPNKPSEKEAFDKLSGKVIDSLAKGSAAGEQVDEASGWK